MAHLVEEYGYASEGESFSIGDPNEVSILLFSISFLSIFFFLSFFLIYPLHRCGFWK